MNIVKAMEEYEKEGFLPSFVVLLNREKGEVATLRTGLPISITNLTIAFTQAYSMLENYIPESDQIEAETEFRKLFDVLMDARHELIGK